MPWVYVQTSLQHSLHHELVSVISGSRLFLVLTVSPVCFHSTSFVLPCSLLFSAFCTWCPVLHSLLFSVLRVFPLRLFSLFPCLFPSFPEFSVELVPANFVHQRSVCVFELHHNKELDFIPVIKCCIQVLYSSCFHAPLFSFSR